MEMYRNALRNNRDRLREAGVASSILVTPTNTVNRNNLAYFSEPKEVLSGRFHQS
ncbi:hypothetical protein [Legionella nagasakiensis]|uniref:hypothetical protein n=1 Tax=Legionella nagasakiensis TaxID=535290 RepID=UPI0013EF9CAE|nr:hypothetical protein [Legionella nagasakiensis]